MANNKARRPPEEIKQAIAEVDRLVADDGMSILEAANKVGIASSVYYRNNAAKKVKGSVNVDSLPPRPKKKRGGYHKARPVDMNDVASLAGRISKLDKKIAGVDALAAERRQLAGALLKLLKP
jgi:hypothetical protein